MEHDNENEPLTFQTLAAATARVLRLEHEQHKTGDGADDGARQDENEKQKKAQREYIERRLSETAEFEARARGVPLRR